MIPHSKPSLGKEEIEAVNAVIRSGMIAGGEKVVQFEEALAQSLGGGFAAACSSGTAALFLALKDGFFSFSSDNRKGEGDARVR